MRLNTKSDDCREEQVVYTLLLAASRDEEKTSVATKNDCSIIHRLDYVPVGRSANTIDTIGS